MIMKALLCSVIFLIFITFNETIYSQSLKTFSLPEPVKIELKRLDEAYKILDQYSNEVWKGWNDYLSYPFLMTFQNGLRILVGHPSPPAEFVPYPYIKVHRLALYIDTTNLNKFTINLPLEVGGGVSALGSFNRKPVTIVDMRFIEPVNDQMKNSDYIKGEDHILVFIHELMHCYQKKFLKTRYGNFSIDPDLDFALYSDIEGQALSLAFEQISMKESLPYLKDFCIARSLKTHDLNESEKNQLSANEFREGEAQYSEYTILQFMKKGFENSVSLDNDPEYNHFTNPDMYTDRYLKRLKVSAGNTLDMTGKLYDYGCFQALLLQRYFPGWEKDIEEGSWLDQIIRNRLTITANDSLLVIERFQNIYHMDELKVKHKNMISERDDTYKMFKERKGRSYIISFQNIAQLLSQLVDKSQINYRIGQTYMYPDGIGDLNFDGISISLKSIPIEVYKVYYIRVIDTNPKKEGEPYSIKYQSKDSTGFYYNAIIETPLFTLKTPKVSIIESEERVIFMIQSRI